MNFSKDRFLLLILAAGGLLSLVTILLATPPGRAAGPWYVAPGGDDGSDCSSPGTPCATINGALAKPGFVISDTILVASGTYTHPWGYQVVRIDKSVTLSGGWDSTFTVQAGTSIIDGVGQRTGIWVKGGVSADVDRFMIQNAGPGVDNYGTLTLNDSVVRSNDDQAGAGIDNAGILTLNNCAVTGNTARNGSGIYNWGTATLNNSTVSGNLGNWHGGGTWGCGIYNTGTMSLNNSTVSGNTATDGGGIHNGGTLSLNNSTVTGNTASGVGGGIAGDGTVTMRNSVLAGNSADIGGSDCHGTLGSAGYSLVGDTSGCTFTPGTGDLTDVGAELGPLLGSPGYHPLLPGSPAIDAGDPTGCTDYGGNPLHTDQRGAARAGICDMGSYEYRMPGPAASIHVYSGTPQRTPPRFDFRQPLKASVLDGIGSPVPNATVSFSAPETGASGTFAVTGTPSTSAETDETSIASAPTFTANAYSGSYTVTATVIGVVAPANFALLNIGWYVVPGGDDDNDCQSPATPCATIDGPLEKAEFFAADTVVVASGTFKGVGDEVVLLDRDAILSGGWDAGFAAQIGTSIIDGEALRRGLTVSEDATAIVGHFTIQNGSAGEGGGVFNQGALTLNRVTVTNNSADYGGGICSSHDFDPVMLTLNLTTVSNNSASRDGGGISCNGTSVLNGSSVSGNTGGGNTGGGGINNGGTLILNNSTISSNSSPGPGGGINNFDSLSLNNSTVSGNMAAAGGGIHSYGGAVSMENTILAANVGGTGPDCSGFIGSLGHNLIGNTSGCTFTPGTGDLTNVSANVGRLIGSPGYHPLLLESPAIDAGNPAGCTDHLGYPLGADQRGAVRLGRCDIGAYEYNPPGPPASISAVAGTPQRTAPFATFGTRLQAAVLDGLGTPVDNVTVTFSAPASGASGMFPDSDTLTTTAGTGESGLVSAATFTANALEGSYAVTATVSGVVTPASFLMSNVGWYVALDGDDANDCQTPTTPCATMEGPPGKAGFLAGDTVLVAAGTYTGAGDEVVLLDKSVRLIGGWTDTFTALSGTSTVDGEGARRAITVRPGVSAIVERFVVMSSPAGQEGGIYNDGTLTLSACTVQDNDVDIGGGYTRGGIYNTDSLTLNGCTVTSNAGPGIHNQSGFVILNSTTLSDNAASGIYNQHIVILNNSTVSGNTGTSGAGVFNSCFLGLNSSTVSGNTAELDGGGINNWPISGGTVALHNTILAGNTASGAGPDCTGEIGSSGFNLIGDAAGCSLTPSTGDLVDVDPWLFRLVGFPGHRPLLPLSPAIDAGNPSGCTDHLGSPLTTDQRGTARPLDGDGDGTPTCDMGSVEFDPANDRYAVVFLPCILRNH
jgi:hypothetical protein